MLSLRLDNIVVYNFNIVKVNKYSGGEVWGEGLPSYFVLFYNKF